MRMRRKKWKTKMKDHPQRKKWNISSYAKSWRIQSGRTWAKEVLMLNLHKREGESSLKTSMWLLWVTFLLSIHNVLECIMIEANCVLFFTSLQFWFLLWSLRPVISSRVIQESKSLLENWDTDSENTKVF